MWLFMSKFCHMFVVTCNRKWSVRCSNMSPPLAGAAVGLLMPDTLTLEERGRFEDIVRSSTLYGEQSPDSSPSIQLPEVYLGIHSVYSVYSVSSVLTIYQCTVSWLSLSCPSLCLVYLCVLPISVLTITVPCLSLCLVYFCVLSIFLSCLSVHLAYFCLSYLSFLSLCLAYRCLLSISAYCLSLHLAYLSAYPISLSCI